MTPRFEALGHGAWRCEVANARPLIVVWREKLLTEEVNLSPIASLVGCVLAQFANSNGRSCFPSQRKIVAVTRYSLRSVQRAIHDLEAGGWVVTKTEPVKGGKVQGQAWRTTYELTLPEEDATVTPSNAEEHASQSPSAPKSMPVSHEEGVSESPYLVKKTKNNKDNEVLEVSVQTVFDYWRDETEKLTERTSGPRKRPTDRRIKKVRARLRDGYTPDQLCEAIDGCLSNSFNVEKGYTDLELICRDDAKVDQYLAWARNDNRAKPQPESGRGAIDAIERGGQNV